MDAVGPGSDKPGPRRETLLELFGPGGPPPGPVVPEDRRQAEREAMEQEAREHYEQALIETGAPPKWEMLLRADPKFAQAVESENDRIYHEAMEERAQRRGTELGLQQRNDDERMARRPEPPPAPTTDINALPGDAFQNILRFVPAEGHRALREVDRRRRDDVRDFHQQRVPHTDRTSFASATTGHYPKSFAKSEYTNREVGLKENLGYAWEEYQKGGKIGSHPGYVERMDDNRFLFHDQRVDPGLRTQLEDSGRLFQPSQGIWTPQMNDAWLLGLLHAGLPIHLLSRPDLECLWDRKEDRPTQTGREILLMLQSGWRALPPEQVEELDERFSPFESGGIVLVPPGGVPRARIQDAEPPGASGLLTEFSDHHAGEFTAPEIRGEHRQPGYGTLDKQQIRNDYIRRRITQVVKICKKYVNNAVAKLRLEAQTPKIGQKKLADHHKKIEQKQKDLENNLLEIQSALATAGLNPEDIEQVVLQVGEQISAQDHKLAGLAALLDKLHQQLHKKKG